LKILWAGAAWAGSEQAIAREQATVRATESVAIYHIQLVRTRSPREPRSNERTDLDGIPTLGPSSHLTDALQFVVSGICRDY
jgi:hypothetical protein